MKYVFLYLILALSLRFNVEVTGQAQFVTVPVTATLQRVDPCYKQIEPKRVKMRKLNRTTQVYDFNVTIKSDWDDITVQADVERWADGGWKPLYTTLEFHVCDIIRYPLVRMTAEPSFKKYVKPPIYPLKCDLDPGLYQFKDLPVDIENILNQNKMNTIGKTKVITSFLVKKFANFLHQT